MAWPEAAAVEGPDAEATCLPRGGLGLRADVLSRGEELPPPPVDVEVNEDPKEAYMEHDNLI